MYSLMICFKMQSYVFLSCKSCKPANTIQSSQKSFTCVTDRSNIQKLLSACRSCLAVKSRTEAQSSSFQTVLHKPKPRTRSYTVLLKSQQKCYHFITSLSSISHYVLIVRTQTNTRLQNISFDRLCVLKSQNCDF